MADDDTFNVRFNAAQASWWAEQERLRPSYLYRPKLSMDGSQWCALMGENLQDGVAGFGESPDAAYRDFDKAWCAKASDKQTQGELR